MGSSSFVIGRLQIAGFLIISLPLKTQYHWMPLPGWLANLGGGSSVIEDSIGYSPVSRISPQGAIFRRVRSARIFASQTSLVCFSAHIQCVAGAYR